MSVQTKPPDLRACTSRQQELRRRLEKIQEEKDMIVNTLEQTVKGVDLLVGHVCGLKSIDHFFYGFVNATATMDQLSLKMFRIHLMLTESSYIDGVQQRAPQMAITFPSSTDDSEDGDSQVTVIDGNENMRSSRSSPQHSSGASSRRLSFSEELVGHTTLATSPVHPQQTVPHVLALDHGASRSVSSLKAPASGIAGKTPALAANHSTTMCGEAYATNVSTVMKQHPSAEPSNTTSFDQDDGCFYRGGNGLNKWSNVGSYAVQPNVPLTSPHPVQNQGGQIGAVGDGTSSITRSQAALHQSTSLVCSSTAAQELGKPMLVHHQIPAFYPEIIKTTQDVVLSFYKNPAEFWLQLESSAEELGFLLEKLQAYYSCSTGRQRFTPKPGMSCAAFYAEDGHWYRARIVQVFPDHAIVYYVDFGNTDRVELNSLYLLEEQFASLPEQALYCGIQGLKIPCGSNTFSREAVRSFRDRISAQNVKLQAFFHVRDFCTRYHVDITAKPQGNGVMNLSKEFLALCVKEGSPLLHTPDDDKEKRTPFNSFMDPGPSSPKPTSSSTTASSGGMQCVPPGIPLSSMLTPVTPTPGMLPTSMLSSYTAPLCVPPAGRPAVALAPPPVGMPPTRTLPASMLQTKVPSALHFHLACFQLDCLHMV